MQQANRTKRSMWAALGAGVAAAATWLFPSARPAAVAAPKPAAIPPPLLPRATAVVQPVVVPPAAPPPLLAPYTDPNFGSDRLRNTDETLLETYLYPPLETTGKTYANEHAFKEVDEEAVPAKPVERYQYVRLRVTATRDPGASAVHLGGIKFFWGTQSVTEPMTIWNPHTGERYPYTAGTPWSDDDQKEVVFHFAEPVAFTRYQLKTSTQSALYDPVRWILEGSKNGTFWEILDAKTEHDWPVPLVRSMSLNFLVRS